MTERTDKPGKIVDTQMYVSMLREIVGENHTVSLLISGNSMSPFLIDGRDTIVIEKPRMPMKKGDMAFYQRKNGQFVMHRICRVIKKKTGENLYYMIGDAQKDREGPMEQDRIFGHITMVCRKGKWITKGNFWWEFFEHIWIRMIPLRLPLMAVYGKFAGRKHD